MSNPQSDRKPTEEQLWSGPSGQRWLASAARFEKTLQPVGDALLEHADLHPGQHVIDIGCGAGAMSLDIAQRIAPNGSITGLDISPDLIQEATRRAAAAAPKVPIRFLRADAARSNLPPSQADRLISRFGSLFFSDPYAAFTHLQSLLRPSSRLALATWAPIDQNSWMLEMRNIMAAHFDLPKIPPRTPGPFAFDEPDYLRDILTKAKFDHIEITPWQSSMFVGGPGSDPDSATDFLLQASSIAQPALNAPEPIRLQIRNQLRTRLQSYTTPQGVQMPASVYFATARA